MTLLAYELLQNFFATDPDRPRPLGVMAGGAAATDEDYMVCACVFVNSTDMGFLTKRKKNTIS